MVTVAQPRPERVTVSDGALAKQWSDVGESIREALRKHTEGISDVRARLVDQQTQLGAQNISLNAVRAEVLGRIDQAELTMLTKFAEVQAQLLSIATAIAGLGPRGV